MIDAGSLSNTSCVSVFCLRNGVPPGDLNSTKHNYSITYWSTVWNRTAHCAHTALLHWVHAMYALLKLHQWSTHQWSKMAAQHNAHYYYFCKPIIHNHP